MKDISSDSAADWVKTYRAHVAGRYVSEDMVEELIEHTYFILSVHGVSIAIHMDMITDKELPGKIAGRFFGRELITHRGETSMGSPVWIMEEETIPVRG